MIDEKPFIYLVDDDSEIRTIYNELLKNRGYSVQTYETAEEFFAADLEIKMDCILLDYNLPI